MRAVGGTPGAVTLGERLTRFFGKGAVHFAVVGIALLRLVPSLGLFVTSFRTRAASAQSGWWTAVVNGGWTVDQYIQVLTRGDLPPPGFDDNFVNSVIITVPSTILPIVVAALAAYAFAWMRFPGRDWIFLGIVALLVIPLQVTWVPVLQIFNDLGLTGTFLGIWLAHTGYGLPFAILLLRSFFAELPRELFESARVDGAGDVKIFLRIVVPLSVPVLASLAIFQFLWVWNDLMNALIFLQTPDKFPLTVGIRNLLGQYGNEWHLLASGAFISMSVPLLVFFALQRYFVRGITAGAVKG